MTIINPINPINPIKHSIHTVQWPVQNVQAFTTTRIHPFDKPLINSKNDPDFNYFNLGNHVGDELINIQQNRQALLKLLPTHCKIQWLNQVHGCHVHQLIKYSEDPIEADAIITREKNSALSIMTADCLPILIANKQGNEIAAIHGGWRSLAKNIIEKTVAKMNSRTDELYVWLGPCIGAHAFEVGDVVRDIFINKSSAFNHAFTKSFTKHKFLTNLHSIAKIQLHQLGVANVVELNHCTYACPHEYYSYRRHMRTGRMATVICLL